MAVFKSNKVNVENTTPTSIKSDWSREINLNEVFMDVGVVYLDIDA